MYFFRFYYFGTLQQSNLVISGEIKAAAIYFDINLEARIGYYFRLFRCG